MDIISEIAVWGVMALVFAAALGWILPDFFRFVRANGADVYPDFLDSAPHSAPRGENV